MKKQHIANLGALIGIVSPLGLVIACGNNELSPFEKELTKINDQISTFDATYLSNLVGNKEIGDFVGTHDLGINLWAIDYSYLISNITLNSEWNSTELSLKILVEVTNDGQIKTKEVTVFASDSPEAQELALQEALLSITNISSSLNGQALANLIADKDKEHVFTAEDLGVGLWDLPEEYEVTFTLNIEPSEFDNEFLPVIVNVTLNGITKQKEITIFSSDSIFIEEQKIQDELNKIINIRSTKTASQINTLVQNLNAGVTISPNDLGITLWPISQDYIVTITLKENGSQFNQKQLNVVVQLQKSNIITRQKEVKIAAEDYQESDPPKIIVDATQKWEDSSIDDGVLNLYATDDPEAQNWKSEIEAAITALDDVDGWITPTYNWVSELDVTSPGRYPLRVEAKDYNGNLATYVLMVSVIN